MNTARALPSRGLAFGEYPQRAEAGDATALWDTLRGLRGRLAVRGAVQLPAGVAQVLAAARPRWRALDEAGLLRAISAVRGRLRREGLTDLAAGAALALAAEAMRRTLDKAAYDTQILAAWLMLNGHLVEMATGEGKTLAAALAAAVAGLGGSPVHVLTANDYLVRRDRDALEPFYAALGLSSACVVGAMGRDDRAQAWQRDIVYATAREVTFDYLRDHLALGGERDARVLRARALAGECDTEVATGRTATQPLLPGLCVCLVDEADSILLDEAVVPLILAAPTHALDADAYRRVYEISCTLHRERDYTLVHARRAAVLNAAGRERVSAAVEGATGVLSPARRAWELVEAALAARLLYRRDREYTVVDEQLLLIDELTGRIANGRQWQGALHPMVEIKEGLEPSAPTATAAQITYQRFFPRYLKLGGMSGTLLETRHELRVLYDAPVLRVPLSQPDRRRWLGERCFVDAAHKWRAVLLSVRAQVEAGRPVLVGTDSVAESAHLSALLGDNGIHHQLLNATQDADEAERIARAGVAGMVTVATNIAGRGTDIRLDPLATSRGGLHVIAAMRNRSRRIDRQLIGRAARHGDPGSAEALVALDDGLLRQAWPAAVLAAAARCARRGGNGADAGRVPGWLAKPLFSVAQRRTEWRDRAHRRELRRADRHAAELYGFAGGTE
jgi:preprotein translocase subunit SecA